MKTKHLGIEDSLNKEGVVEVLTGTVGNMTGTMTLGIGITQEIKIILGIENEIVLKIGTEIILEIGEEESLAIGEEVTLAIGKEEILEIEIGTVMKIGKEIMLRIGKETTLEIGIETIMKIEREIMLQIEIETIMEVMIILGIMKMRSLMVKGIKTSKIVQRIGVDLGVEVEEGLEIIGERTEETSETGIMRINRVEIGLRGKA